MSLHPASAAAIGCLTLLFTTAPAAAQDHPSAVWTLLTENDWIAGTDQNYTAAWKAGRTAWIDPVRFPATLLGSEAGDGAYLQLSLGQQIYSAADKFETEPQFDQHPYAAWLYGEALVAVDHGEGRPVDQLRVQLGTVGPAALGEEIQNGVHGVIGGDSLGGWENQIGNQPGLLISYDRKWTTLERGEGAWQSDVIPHAGLNLGNVLVSANAGVTWRFGRNLDRPFGTPRNEPGTGGIAWWEPAKGAARAAYMFLGAEARAVGHAIWLDGRPFTDDLVTQKSKPFVYDLEGGIVLPIPFIDARLTASYIRRSQTFKQQVEPRAFGSFSISTRF